MSRKRSAYRPKPVVTNPLVYINATPQNQRTVKLLRFHAALDSICRGSHPGRQEWQDLCDVVNVLETMAVHLCRIDPATVRPTLAQATVSMQAAAKRYQAGQSLRLDAVGITAMRDALGMYEQCLEQFTEREIAIAEAETVRIIAEYQRNPRKGVEVVEM